MRPTDCPLVTVITPALNMGRFIGETVRSVLGQTLHDFEYLVVDNGSDDDTAAVVAGFAAGDHRVRLLHEARRGSAAARNLGLAEARGRYLAFIDADDVWLPAKLETQLRQLEALPDRYGGVFCRSVVTDEHGVEQFTYAPPTGTYDLHSFLMWCNPAANGSSFLVRRELYEQAGGFDEQLASLQDLEWLLRLLRDGAAPLLLGTEQALVRYRRRQGSISSDVGARMVALETVINRYDTTGNPLAWLRPALMAHRCGRSVEALRWGRRTMRYGRRRLLRSPDGRRLLAFQLRAALSGFGRPRRRAELRLLAPRHLASGSRAALAGVAERKSA